MLNSIRPSYKKQQSSFGTGFVKIPRDTIYSVGENLTHATRVKNFVKDLGGKTSELVNNRKVSIAPYKGTSVEHEKFIAQKILEKFSHKTDIVDVPAKEIRSKAKIIAKEFGSLTSKK